MLKEKGKKMKYVVLLLFCILYSSYGKEEEEKFQNSKCLDVCILDRTQWLGLINSRDKYGDIVSTILYPSENKWFNTDYDYYQILRGELHQTPICRVLNEEYIFFYLNFLNSGCTNESIENIRNQTSQIILNECIEKEYYYSFDIMEDMLIKMKSYNNGSYHLTKKCKILDDTMEELSDIYPFIYKNYKSKDDDNLIITHWGYSSPINDTVFIPRYLSSSTNDFENSFAFLDGRKIEDKGPIFFKNGTFNCVFITQRKKEDGVISWNLGKYSATSENLHIPIHEPETSSSFSTETEETFPTTETDQSSSSVETEESSSETEETQKQKKQKKQKKYPLLIQKNLLQQIHPLHLLIQKIIQKIIQKNLLQQIHPLHQKHMNPAMKITEGEDTKIQIQIG